LGFILCPLDTHRLKLKLTGRHSHYLVLSSEFRLLSFIICFFSNSLLPSASLYVHSVLGTLNWSTHTTLCSRSQAPKPLSLLGTRLAAYHLMLTLAKHQKPLFLLETPLAAYRLMLKLTKHPTGRIPPYAQALKAPHWPHTTLCSSTQSTPLAAYHLMFKAPPLLHLMLKAPHWPHWLAYTALCSSTRKALPLAAYHLMLKLTKHPTGRIPPYAQARKAPPLARIPPYAQAHKAPHWSHTTLCSNTQSTPLVAYRLMLTLAKHSTGRIPPYAQARKAPHWSHTTLCSRSQAPNHCLYSEPHRSRTTLCSSPQRTPTQIPNMLFICLIRRYMTHT
jgi:hypothetical protein